MRARSEFKNYQQEKYHFRLRLGVGVLLVLICFSLLGGRLFYLQMTKYDYFQTLAENNRISLVPIAPNRGLILDRNGVVLQAMKPERSVRTRSTALLSAVDSKRE